MSNLSRPLTLAIFLICGASHANAADIPSSADPSRQNYQNPSKADDYKKLVPASKSPANLTAPAPEGSEYKFFTLNNIEVTGATAYSTAEISPLYAKDIGQKISVAQLYNILNLLQQKYLDDGYSLTRVSLAEQNLAKGNIQIHVMEGFAALVEKDASFPKSAVLDDAAAQIAAMRPLNTKKLERILLLLNELGGLDVSAVLGAAPQGTPEGGIRLILKRNTKDRTSGSLGVNNHGSLFSGPIQIIGNVETSSILTPFDTIGLSASAAVPTSEMKYVSVQYQRPIFGARGLNLSVEGSKSITTPGNNLKELEVKGNNHSFKTSLSYASIKQRDETLKLNTSFEVRNTQTDLSGAQLYDDRLRIASFGLNYHHADQYNGLNAAEITYSQGLNILGARKTGSEDLSRSEGHSDFKKIYVSLGRLQSLPFKFEFLTAIIGQYALKPLLSSEEFGFGGAQFGRGYDPSEITGDKGFATTFELRRNIPYGGDKISLQGYSFFDFGKVWNIDPGSKNKMSAASTGIGLRAASKDGWSCDVNLAIPLTRPAANPPQYGNKQSPRLLFSVQKRF